MKSKEPSQDIDDILLDEKSAEPDLHKSFVKESERYKELYNHLSKLSIFYGDYYIFESIVL